MHLYLGDTIALAGFTATAFDIKAKPPGAITSGASFLGAGKQFPHRGKDAGVGGWIGAGRAAYRALVDIYTLIQVAQAGDFGMGGRF